MKNILLLLGAFTLLFTSCEDDDNQISLPVNAGFSIYSPESFSETDGLIEIEVRTSSRLPTETVLEFSYDLFGMTEDDFEFETSSNSVVIPANQLTGTIVIELFDNQIANDTEQYIDIKLTSVNGTPVLGNDQITGLTNKRIIVIDNDCPIDLNPWIGTYDVSEVFTSGPNAGVSLGNAFGESYQVELTAVTSDPTGTRVEFTNSTGFNAYFDNGTVMQFITCDGQVSFNSPRIAEFAVMTIESSSYDEDTLTITCDGPLGNFGPYQFILTKQ